MTFSNNKMSTDTIEKRRIELLNRLDFEAHPLAIFYDLTTNESVAFTLSDSALNSIRHGLSKRKRRVNESSALVKTKIVALTADKSNAIYEVTQFTFENLGTSDSVMVERERLNPGEIEVHTHVHPTPDYLGHTDVGDLIATVEGPAWVHPTNAVMLPAVRIFGILSIYHNRIAQLQFYQHDLRELLLASNNYGLKKLGLAVTIQNAY